MTPSRIDAAALLFMAAFLAVLLALVVGSLRREDRCASTRCVDGQPTLMVRGRCVCAEEGGAR